VDPDGRTGVLTWASEQFDDTDRILRKYAEDTPYVGGAVGLVRGAMSLGSLPTRALNTTSDAVAQALPFEVTNGVSAEGSMGLGQVVDPTVYAASNPGQTANAVYGNIVDTTSRTFFDGDGAAASDFTSGIVQMAPMPNAAQAVFRAGAKAAKQLVEKANGVGVALRSFDNFDGNVGAEIADDLSDFDGAGPRGTVVGSTDQIKMDTGGSIGDQGLPYEKFVGQSMQAQDKLPDNFKTFDYFNESTGVATSVKTINTTLLSKVADPRKVFNTMRRDINKAANFNKPYKILGVTLDPSAITARVVKVAVPRATTSEQWAQISRAIDHGRQVGVKVEVEVVDVK